MNKWWYVISLTLILFITFILFFYIPNGVLLTVATIPYIIWWLTFKEKTHYLLIPVALFLFIFILIILPVLEFSGFMEEVAFLSNIFLLLYPSGYQYSWSQQVPNIIMTSLMMTIGIILFIKLMIWVLRNLSKSVSKTNMLLALSRFLMYILFIYFFLGLIPAIIGQDTFSWFFSFFATSLFYEIFFIWLPFVVMYFFLEWLVLKFMGRLNNNND